MNQLEIPLRLHVELLLGELLLGKAYSDFVHVGDAITVCDQIISSHPDDFRGYLVKKDGPGASGGQPWTAQWLKFDNSYFKDIKAKKDEDILVLPTDAALFDDPSFKVYAEAHGKRSNLGAKFDPPEVCSH
ncbi:hypothetical protein TSUD_247140 [Trifolium subterraneum]|uniref:Uncharacterized protein n=1 Tax=Trifolium subterraneum TaxID=3900 RepID=A0A2Z6MHW9_TRISU|nr:hypothetical protein TSUD_247140 [Trifolium subterraneum]